MLHQQHRPDPGAGRAPRRGFQAHPQESALSKAEAANGRSPSATPLLLPAPPNLTPHPTPASGSSPRALSAQGGQGGALGPGQQRRGQGPGRNLERGPAPPAAASPAAPPCGLRAHLRPREQSPRRRGRGRSPGGGIRGSRARELRLSAPSLGGGTRGRADAPSKRNHVSRRGC